MTQPGGSDPTQKFWTQPPAANAAKATVLGWLLVACFAILIVIGIIPQFIWLFFERSQYGYGGSWIADQLTSHIYWVAMIMMLVGGLRMVAGKPTAYVPAKAAIIAWLGMLLMQVAITTLRYPSAIFQVLQGTFGIQFPPTINSLGSLFLLVVFVYGLISLSSPDMKLLLDVSPQKKSRAMLVGLGMVGYGALCMLIKEIFFTSEVLPYVDFQF